jgi:hypothetical protein
MPLRYGAYNSDPFINKLLILWFFFDKKVISLVVIMLKMTFTHYRTNAYTEYVF